MVLLILYALLRCLEWLLLLVTRCFLDYRGFVYNMVKREGGNAWISRVTCRFIHTCHADKSESWHNYKCRICNHQFEIMTGSYECA